MNHLTLSDLYNSLDWIGLKTGGQYLFGSRKFRETLLAYALPTQIVGELHGQSPERQHEARVALKAAGVWDQVVDWMIAQHLLGPEDPDAQLTFQLDLRNVGAEQEIGR